MRGEVLDSRRVVRVECVSYSCANKGKTFEHEMRKVTLVEVSAS